MAETKLPWRIYRVEDQCIFHYVTTVVAETQRQAVHDFEARYAPGDQVFVAAAWADHGPPQMLSA